MNELHSRYSAQGLVFLGVPSNQFGYQENCKNDEILRSLKSVRPGNGFEPKFQLLEKVDVNGKDAHPLFVYLKEKLPFPCDDPMALMTNPSTSSGVRSVGMMYPGTLRSSWSVLTESLTSATAETSSLLTLRQISKTC